MFNLETAISTWKRLLELIRSFRKDDIEELERHIRDVVRDKVADGMSEEEGYRTAIKQIGDIVGLESEYRKVYWDKVFSNKGVIAELTLEWNMFFNYVRIAVRNLWRNKGYTFINVFGLAAGLACVLLIGLFILDEISFDRHNEHADRIVRVLYGESQTVTPTVVGPVFARNFLEIQDWTRIYPIGMYAQVAVKRGNVTFEETGFYYADSTVFNVFTLDPVLGTAKGALNRPHTVVITETIAKKYFGDENPIGQTIQTGGNTDWEVTMVVRDIPKSSH
jgi:hypothetical protein